LNGAHDRIADGGVADGSEIRARAFRFACSIVQLHDVLTQRGASAREMSRQLIRSATSIGANLEEADAGQSRADFISKCNIALKEARESHYWLRLLRATNKIDVDAENVMHECDRIIGTLTAIVKKSRGD
jgi:four helix bundle protein